MTVDLQALDETLHALIGRLLRARTTDGHWEGHLASSALATATAVGALAMSDAPRHAARIDAGLAWLGAHQNADGGWGDTPLNKSNISTTALGWAACRIAARAGHATATGFAELAPRGAEPAAPGGVVSGAVAPALTGAVAVGARAEEWLRREAGSVAPEALVAAISRRYGKDRTFSVPILTVLAMAGALGEGPAAWRRVPQLPFELAACPHQWFQWLRLPVVSYALPALIAIGQVRHHHRPTRNPLTRALRAATRRGTLRTLLAIQPASGGYLEATPLTSFVVMSLVHGGEAGNEVVARGVRFLLDSQREDGSWPIDTNLATWVTTLSINALAHAHALTDDAGDDNGVGDSGRAAHGGGAASASGARLTPGERERLADWLLGQQHRVEHPYTHAAPGGWAWTDLSGGVPDADDTPGALLALAHLSRSASAAPLADWTERAGQGVQWLIDLQNRDGGIPTFCRGWGALPFDRSSPDLTAHALLAWHTWRAGLLPRLNTRVTRAMDNALAFLARVQRADGAWVPLWFGNEHAPDEENPTYGTARVLIALARIGNTSGDMLPRGMDWLLSAQNQDGGWGGSRGVPSTIEETALAVDALATAYGVAAERTHRVRVAVARGVGWIVAETQRGASVPAAPIGLYFAKLWYYESLYPLIFAVSALGRSKLILSEAGPPKPDNVNNELVSGRLC